MTKRESIEEYLRELEPMMHDFSASYVGGMDREDVYQELYLLVCKLYDRYDASIGKFSTYAYKAFEGHIKALRKASVNRKPLSYQYLGQPKGGSTVGDVLAEREAGGSYEDEYDVNEYALSDFEREVLQLRLEGYTLREVADMLEITRSMAWRVMLRVRDKVGQEGRE